ncbi:N-6 DNA methylase [Acidobacteriia bacterium AH_259_A11_L15]|nr:N-6 DNA methylase [Acidobacteriia bacterium AH_259_A11_L15]
MPFKAYLQELQRNLKSRQATEPSYYPALKSLLEDLDPSVTAIVNPKKTPHGSPDFSVKRRKNVLDSPVGWVEAKDIGDDLKKVEKSDQLKRYRNLPNLVLTDFLEFRWYTNGERRLTARLATVHDRKLKSEAQGEAAVRDLLLGFLQHKTAPVRNSRELALRMAQLAHFIRDAIVLAQEEEPEDGKLDKQLEAFRETLIPDLKPEQFADMYAQTIAYGLFAAACQPRPATERFTRANAAELIPKTNPFLRKLFQEIAGVDLPEPLRPFVDDLVALLRDSDLNSILADFGKRTGKEDPVVHFYEDFLQAYDPKVREMRGVYYTPEPVVSYIVRSIDHLLKTRFNKPDGLADPNVLILDPACGTGTFLFYVIQHIYDHLCAKGQKGAWNSYVSENLLKRVFGFELLMAPYAVAHLKLALQLKDLGYNFESDERLGIYLTNTLEEAIKRSEAMFAQWIADEANAASEIKKEKPIMVVLGNPPYSGHSANKGPWIRRLIDGFVDPKDGKLIEPGYKYVDGQPLGEKNPKWLQDDYVKFIRFAQWRIERTGYGVLGFITNHAYLDNPTFRGMRSSLLNSFSEIYLLNLHGNAKKKEVAPDGIKDENVFDIQQGVAIALYVRRNPQSTRTQYADLWGPRPRGDGRGGKYGFLSKTDIGSTPWTTLEPRAPHYFFVPRNTALEDEYQPAPSVQQIFPLNSMGVTTAHDGFFVDFDPKSLKARISAFLDPALTDQEATINFSLQGWNVPKLRKRLGAEEDWQQRCKPYLYRPFDVRYIFWDTDFLERARSEVMDHFLHKTLGLICIRRSRENVTSNFFATSSISDKAVISNVDNAHILPLYLVEQPRSMQVTPQRPMERGTNLSPDFVNGLEQRLGPLAPADFFYYMYSIFHSPKYRQRYAEFLKTDFPRVPLTSDKKLFRALVEKGAELVSLHLMESPKLSRFITRYEQPGEHTVEKVRWEPSKEKQIPRPFDSAQGRQARDDKRVGRVYINKTQYFEGVPQNVWEFHIGGYQVCEKWLKDRKGRQLSADDINHYQKIVVALNETLRLMREIDEVIPGWPLA